jgi:hypothetical protein
VRRGAPWREAGALRKYHAPVGAAGALVRRRQATDGGPSDGYGVQAAMTAGGLRDLIPATLGL